MVGATGFEPATTGPPVRCATGLRYAPISGRTLLYTTRSAGCRGDCARDCARKLRARFAQIRIAHNRVTPVDASVRWPVNFVATERGTPLRSMFRTAVHENRASAFRGRPPCGTPSATPCSPEDRRQITFRASSFFVMPRSSVNVPCSRSRWRRSSGRISLPYASQSDMRCRRRPACRRDGATLRAPAG
jgi:hypothetical protein